MKTQKELRKTILDVLMQADVDVNVRSNVIDLLFVLSERAYEDGLNRGKDICLEVYKKTR